ncbi:unnamed protein product [Ambrosiozyma monospora]|uniref:Unnamed protein product n=1 Tax=Ambrosiozyma monospora TaxID=43982 RepID=A0ACB5TQU9_AMBMO|nr:unnamed protein product [Ambrosiozyma monospora]
MVCQGKGGMLDLNNPGYLIMGEYLVLEYVNLRKAEMTPEAVEALKPEFDKLLSVGTNLKPTPDNIAVHNETGEHWISNLYGADLWEMNIKWVSSDNE